MTDDEIEKKFKLTSAISCNNLVLFDRNYKIKKYADEIEILEEFYDYRYKLYDQRKQHMIKKMKQELTKLQNQHRFISEIISGELEIFRKRKDQVI